MTAQNKGLKASSSINETTEADQKIKIEQAVKLLSRPGARKGVLSCIEGKPELSKVAPHMVAEIVASVIMGFSMYAAAQSGGTLFFLPSIASGAVAGLEAQYLSDKIDWKQVDQEIDSCSACLKKTLGLSN